MQTPQPSTPTRGESEGDMPVHEDEEDAEMNSSPEKSSPEKREETIDTPQKEEEEKEKGGKKRDKNTTRNTPQEPIPRVPHARRRESDGDQQHNRKTGEHSDGSETEKSEYEYGSR